MIQRQIVVGFALEFRQHLLIVTFHPARSRNVDVFELALNVVFIPQTMRNDIELQWPHGTENQVIVAHRLEQLRSALLAQLRQPFLQRLEAQRIFQHRASEISRARNSESR